jgi:hypothetical protein
MAQDEETLQSYMNSSMHRDPNYDGMIALEAWSRFWNLYGDAMDTIESFCIKVETGQAKSVDTYVDIYVKYLAILKKAGRR